MFPEGTVRLKRIARAVFPAILVFWSIACSTDVTKVQYDRGCTGANTTETILTPANIAVTSFGKIFTKPVDGNVYAQPLYLQDFPIGGGVYNVVFVCTENNSIYAFDADNAAAPAYWQRSLPPPQAITSCNNITPSYGITATPVIDRDAGALYVEAATYENGSYYQKLFAVNLVNGNDLVAPVAITDTVNGTGQGSLDGKIHLDPLIEFCRPGLLLLNDKIYFGMGSHCDDGDFHGWLFACNASNLARSASLCLTPNDSEGSIWQSGAGLSSDGASLFCTSGNGSFDPATGAYGLSALKLDRNLNVLSFFTPYNYNSLNDIDWDLCSGVMLIPGTSLCTVMGKSGAIYLIDQSNLGGNHPSADSIVQRLDSAFASDPEGNDPVPVFWNNLLFMWAGEDSVRAFAFNGTKFNASLQSSNPVRQGISGGAITLSANGNSSGILWGTNFSNGHFYAFDASHIASMLWNDGLAASGRDRLGSPVVKFARPIVANGKVFVPTANSLVAYGLLNEKIVIGNSAHGIPATPVGSFRITRHCISIVFNRPGNFKIVLSDTRGRIAAGVRGTTAGGDERIPLPGTGLPPGAYVAFVRLAQQKAAIQVFVTN
jgi:hypothetical protein